MKINDKHIKDLVKKRIALIKEQDKLSASEENKKNELAEQIFMLNKEINERTLMLIKNKQEEKKMDQDEKKDVEEKKDAQEEKKEETPKSTPNTEPAKEAKGRKGSSAELIIRALMRKTIKNVDQAVEYVKEQKPDRKETNIKAQINTIIKLVDAGEKPRWQKYSWNKDEFLLVEKE